MQCSLVVLLGSAIIKRNCFGTRRATIRRLFPSFSLFQLRRVWHVEIFFFLQKARNVKPRNSHKARFGSTFLKSFIALPVAVGKRSSSSSSICKYKFAHVRILAFS